MTRASPDGEDECAVVQPPDASVGAGPGQRERVGDAARRSRSLSVAIRELALGVLAEGDLPGGSEIRSQPAGLGSGHASA
jgi:hypothetical protein